MAQNITLLGASYSDVPAVELPKTGGGTAAFADPSGTTATASDVAQGKLFLNSSGILTTGTASGGGGGASNFVQGTFTGTTAGEILEINVPYTGSGYPIAVMIFPKEGGYNSSGTFYNTIQRYAIHTWGAVKNYPLSAPDYTGKTSNNQAFTLVRYKGSDSSPTVYGSAGTTNYPTYNTTLNPSSTSNGACKISSSTKMKVLIASTSYGFMAEIEYVYCIVYST